MLYIDNIFGSMNKGIPQLVDAITRLNNDIDKVLANNTALLDVASSDSINVKTFDLRDVLIDNLTTINKLLNTATAKIMCGLDRAQVVKSRELATIDAILNKKSNLVPTQLPTMPIVIPTQLPTVIPSQDYIEPEIEGNQVNIWTTVQKRKQDTQSRRTLKQYSSIVNNPVNIPIVPVTPPTSATTPTHTSIKITEALSLPAITVGSFNQVAADGNLYYVANTDHFAIRVAGYLFHGNIGVIYTDEKNPEKIKDCRYSTNCIKHDKCDYYHDPMKFVGSRDHRNYIASSFLYAPPNSFYKNKARSRRFGSREHLDIDIANIQDDEVSRFNNQLMHDLLCALLLNQTAM